MAVYPREFRPFATNDLVRVGSRFDGGYVVPQRCLEKSNGLLSFGVNEDWFFEKEFSQRKRLPVVAFDPTVNARFWMYRMLASLYRGVIKGEHWRLPRFFRVFGFYAFFAGPNRRHIKRWVGKVGKDSVTLKEALAIADLPRPIFFKIDIEGSEYAILNEIIETSDQYTGIAIEFHMLAEHAEDVIRFVNATRVNFVLVHFHPNTNTVPSDEAKADVIEMTFLHRKHLHEQEQLIPRDLPIPELDNLNMRGDKEVSIQFETG